VSSLPDDSGRFWQDPEQCELGKSTAADNGRHTFYVTFNTIRQQSLTVSDNANNITNSFMFGVAPGLPFRKGRR
jgi:hypothetical protein